MKISELTKEEFTDTKMELCWEDMQLRLLDGTLKKMETDIGSFKTLGVPIGEKKDSSESHTEKLTLMLVQFLLCHGCDQIINLSIDLICKFVLFLTNFFFVDLLLSLCLLEINF